MKVKGLFFAAMTAALFFVSGCERESRIQLYDETVQTEEESYRDGEETAGHMPETGTNDRIYVYVCGAVKVPGVVEVSTGARVYEAVEKAGGMTDEAADYAVNQAAVLEDGQQITVPTREEAGKPNPEGNPGTAEKGEEKVNINQAAAEELMSLPGIGEAKAAGLIEYRETAGGFQSIEEIQEVSGIGEAVYQRIKDRIVI